MRTTSAPSTSGQASLASEAHTLTCLVRGTSVGALLVEAVEGRLAQPPAPGAEVVVAGQPVGGASPEEMAALEEREAQARMEALGDWLAGGARRRGRQSRAGRGHGHAGAARARGDVARDRQR